MLWWVAPGTLSANYELSLFISCFGEIYYEFSHVTTVIGISDTQETQLTVFYRRNQIDEYYI